jgi:hypothetical protein
LIAKAGRSEALVNAGNRSCSCHAALVVTLRSSLFSTCACHRRSADVLGADTAAVLSAGG